MFIECVEKCFLHLKRQLIFGRGSWQITQIE